MVNLKELFPVVTVEGTERPIAFFLVYNAEEGVDNGWRLNVLRNREPWSIPNTEEQAYADLEDLFEDLTSEKDLWNREVPYSLERAKNKIAAGTRRGAGNVEYGNYVFYHGNESADRLATVMKNDIGYFVFVNPKAENYIERFIGVKQ